LAAEKRPTGAVDSKGGAVAAIRIGMLTPSSNTVLEPLTSRVAWKLDQDFTVHYTRLPVTEISLRAASLQQFDEPAMLAAARLLADAKPSAMCWNGTSGAWKGLDADRAICASIERETGVPATTGTLGQMAAFRQLGVKRYALAVPYVDAVREAIVEVYEQQGFECTSSVGLGISVNYDFAEVPLPAIRDLVRRADHPDAECVVVVCTNLAAGLVVEELEEELAKPIFDSTLVSLWHPLRLAGYRRPIRGWGRLLATE
jgi:maleate isomerase